MTVTDMAHELLEQEATQISSPPSVRPCRRGLKLNPITSLYYISPACFAFLLLPFLCFELPKIRNDPNVVINPAVLLSNATAAFGAPHLPLCCAHIMLLMHSIRIAMSPCDVRLPQVDCARCNAALNMAVFLLIGKTSALTMNIAGVVKDWLLIGLSVWLYKCVNVLPDAASQWCLSCKYYM
jgi:hypothetical protein